jgi:hypothetical protein
VVERLLRRIHTTSQRNRLAYFSTCYNTSFYLPRCQKYIPRFLDNDLTGLTNIVNSHRDISPYIIV